MSHKRYVISSLCLILLSACSTKPLTVHDTRIVERCPAAPFLVLTPVPERPGDTYGEMIKQWIPALLAALASANQDKMDAATTCQTEEAPQ